MTTALYIDFLSPEECEDILENGVLPYEQRLAEAFHKTNDEVFQKELGELVLNVSEDELPLSNGNLVLVLQLSTSQDSYYEPEWVWNRAVGTMLVLEPHIAKAIGPFVVGYA